MQSCETCSPKNKGFEGHADFTVALAGNANVGKSAIFYQLTGVGQIIGNWPGKTVERAEGLLQHRGQKIKVIDLPGIYSFSTFSMEELVSREFIATERPEVVVNVVDATSLERNLFFTIQLMELEAPLIIALNQIDLMKKKGILINFKKLERLLGIRVVPTIAIKGKGILQLTEQIIKVKQKKGRPKEIKYGREVEQRIKKLVHLLKKIDVGYPKRWVAIKLLEKDPEAVKLVSAINKNILSVAAAFAKDIERIHGEPCSIVIAAERYRIADEIARAVQKIEIKEETLSDKIDKIALHPALGYFMVAGVVLGLMIWTFVIGFKMSTFLTNIFSSIEQFEPVVSGPIKNIIWNGAFTGFVAGITLVIPYVLPFYILLAVIEDSGYLTRISIMLDGGMHKLGLHGKAIIPLILGYGCNVPACFSCRIMETPKQKLLAAFLVTLMPCTARTVVIFGLVAAFVNIWAALALYIFDILLIIILGRIAFKVVPGESVGLIMEIPDYHVPSLKIIMEQTWIRIKSLLWVVFPAYIIGSAGLQAVYAAGLLTPVNNVLSIITVKWLGLPAVVGTLLVFGIIRKELTILMLSVIFQTTDFASILSPVQLIILALVSMIYIPCLATILALAKEFGWKKSILITIIEVGLAILIGGAAFRALNFIL